MAQTINRKIYFDNAATTKPLPEAEVIFKKHLDTEWSNPSALYSDAVEAENRLKAARETVRKAVNADTVFFTSCGTESNNTVIFGGMYRTGKKMHFITSSYEHACVYECIREQEARGNDVSFIMPRDDGKIHPEDVAAAVRSDTALVSIMHVNNETGAINDIDGIAKAVKKVNPRTVFHSDGVQGFIKVPFDMRKSQVDYYTASAHKVHALKGTGAIFCKKNTPLKAYILGGGQESAMRSGTENTLGISVFAKACEVYLQNREQYCKQIISVREALLDGLSDIPNIRIISPEDSAPHILSISFIGVRGEVLLHSLSAKGIEISVGSACSSKKRRNRVHESLKLSPEIAEGIVRISFSHENTVDEAIYASKQIVNDVKLLREFRRI